MAQQPILPNVSRSSIIQGVAIYLLVAAFFGLCGGVLALTGGAFAGLGGLAGLANSSFDETGELAAASAELTAVSGLLVVTGIVSIIMAPVQLVAAIGLFRRNSWARMLTVIIAGASAVLSALSFLSGGDITQIVWLALGAFVAYFFYTDYEIKRELSN